MGALEEYFKDWLEVIDINKLFKTVKEINNLYKTKSVMPEYRNIFKAFTLCSLHNLKVVFLGQDPYPQKGIATGILFGNKENSVSLSPSLEIIKEASINYEIPHNSYKFDITLESWAKQGILLLNSALTVETNKVGSHTMIWRPFISDFLKTLSSKYPGILYVLFGSQAQTFEPYIGKNNLIMKVQHPAYYARIQKKMPSEIFKQINEIIDGKYRVNINWYNDL